MGTTPVSDLTVSIDIACSLSQLRSYQKNSIKISDLSSCESKGEKRVIV